MGRRGGLAAMIAMALAGAAACGGQLSGGELAENVDADTRERFGPLGEHATALVGTHVVAQASPTGERRVAVVELAGDGSLRVLDPAPSSRLRVQVDRTPHAGQRDGTWCLLGSLWRSIDATGLSILLACRDGRAREAILRFGARITAPAPESWWRSMQLETVGDDPVTSDGQWVPTPFALVHGELADELTRETRETR